LGSHHGVQTIERTYSITSKLTIVINGISFYVTSFDGISGSEPDLREIYNQLLTKNKYTLQYSSYFSESPDDIFKRYTAPRKILGQLDFSKVLRDLRLNPRDLTLNVSNRLVGNFSQSNDQSQAFAGTIQLSPTLAWEYGIALNPNGKTDLIISNLNDGHKKIDIRSAPLTVQYSLEGKMVKITVNYKNQIIGEIWP
jgi:hypothetical protein